MNSKLALSLASSCLLGASFLVGSVHATTRLSPTKFSAVAKITKAKCLSCHNAARHPEGVDLSSYASLMKGGEKGPLVMPGQPEKSALLLYVDGTKQPRMPFRQAPLSKGEIAAIRSWIKAGAKP